MVPLETGFGSGAGFEGGGGGMYSVSFGRVLDSPEFGEPDSFSFDSKYETSEW